MSNSTQGAGIPQQHNEMDIDGDADGTRDHPIKDKQHSGDHQGSPGSVDSHPTTMISPTTSATTMGVLSNATSVDASPKDTDARHGKSAIMKPAFLPANFNDCSMNDLVALISNMLTQLILHNVKIFALHWPLKLTNFIGPTPSHSFWSNSLSLPDATFNIRSRLPQPHSHLHIS